MNSQTIYLTIFLLLGLFTSLRCQYAGSSRSESNEKTDKSVPPFNVSSDATTETQTESATTIKFVNLDTNVSSTVTTISSNLTTTTTAGTTLAPKSTSTTSITSAPSLSTTPTPIPLPCHRFDGSSFIGGIVLALGLIAIGLVAYKFYKARNERNYHTL